MAKIINVRKPRINFAVKGDELEIELYDPIGEFWGMTAKDFSRQLREAGDVSLIRVKINSPGGDVFDGVTIMNELKQHPAVVEARVMGVAASAASIIAMAGDEIIMSEGAQMMIHNAWMIAVGDYRDMQRASEMLIGVGTDMQGIYSRRTGKSAEDVAKMMDDETWLTSEQAVEQGFADRLLSEESAAAWRGDAAVFAFLENAPAPVKELIEEEPEGQAPGDEAGIVAADLNRLVMQAVQSGRVFQVSENEAGGEMPAGSAETKLGSNRARNRQRLAELTARL